MSFKATPYRIVDGGTGAATAAGARTNLSVPSTTEAVLVTGVNAFTGNQSMGSNRLTNVSDPTSAQDAATKAYTDSVASGLLDFKNSVRVATTANITLSGAQTIDGVSAIAGDRVLVKDQTTASENGIYVVAAGAWSRSTDADISSEVTAGMYTFVSEGTAAADSAWVLSTNDPITLNTTSLTFVQFSGLGQVTAGAGLTKTGNTLDVVGTAGRITVNANDVDISATYVGQTSITTLGTITTGTWTGTDIAVADGGTGSSTASGARSNLSAAPNSPQYLVSVADGELANADVATAGTGITITNGTNTSTFAIDTAVVVTLTGSQTLTNKTLTSPVINTPRVTWTTSDKTADYTLTTSDYVVIFNIGTTDKTATLPTAASASGQTFRIKNRAESTVNLIVDPNAAEEIDNASTYTLFPGDAVDVHSNGTEWFNL